MSKHPGLDLPQGGALICGDTETSDEFQASVASDQPPDFCLRSPQGARYQAWFLGGKILFRNAQDEDLSWLGKLRWSESGRNGGDLVGTRQDIIQGREFLLCDNCGDVIFNERFTVVTD